MMSTGTTVSISSAPEDRITNALFPAMLHCRAATAGCKDANFCLQLPEATCLHAVRESDSRVASLRHYPPF